MIECCDRVLLGKRVLIGEKEIRGVIGAKAIHLQEVDERKKSIKSTELYIDIGAKDMEEAESMVPRGSERLLMTGLDVPLLSIFLDKTTMFLLLRFFLHRKK